MANDLGQLRDLLLAELKGLRGELTASEESRVAQLRRDLAVMTQAAIEREKEFGRRESELNSKLLSSATQAHTAKFDAAQLGDKLAAAESLNRALTAQAVQIEGTLRAQAAQIGGLTAQHAQSIAQVEGVNHALEAKRQEFDGKLNEARAEIATLLARVAELSTARSRRLLVKLGLVRRCPWEN